MNRFFWQEILKELIPEITSGRMKIMLDVHAFLKNIEIYKPIISAINGLCLAGGTELIQSGWVELAKPNKNLKAQVTFHYSADVSA